MGASKVFDANAMGSVASLQSFKRRPSSPGASFMLGQLDSGGSMMDDNSSFYTEMQSNMGNQSRMISSRGNTASRNSTRSLGATFIPKTGVYIPGMTPIAGPPIASFKSPHASMYESSIASSMNVNSRLDSNGRKYLAERRDSFASEDLNDAKEIGDVNASLSMISGGPLDLFGIGESKHGSPAQSTRKGSSAGAGADGDQTTPGGKNWFKTMLYTTSQTDIDDNASYTKPFSAHSARYAHPHTAGAGLFGMTDPGRVDAENSIIGGNLNADSWVRKDRGRESPNNYMMGQSATELKSDQEPRYATEVSRGSPAAPRSGSKHRTNNGTTTTSRSRSRHQSRNRGSKSTRHRDDSEDFGDAMSVLTDDRGTASPTPSRLADFVDSQILRSRATNSTPQGQGYIYRKYAGRMRRRAGGDRGAGPSGSAEHEHGGAEAGPGGHSTRVRLTSDDFDLSMQHHFQVRDEINAPMPIINFEETGGGGGGGVASAGAEGGPVNPAAERFGLFPREGSPTVVAASGPGGFLYSSGEQNQTGQGSSFPMFQY